MGRKEGVKGREEEESEQECEVKRTERAGRLRKMKRKEN